MIIVRRVIHLEGKIKARSYDDKQGIKKYVTKIIAEQIILLDKKEQVVRILYLLFSKTIKLRSTHFVLPSRVSGKPILIKYYYLQILNSTNATSLHNNYELCIVLVNTRKVRIFTSYASL